MTKFEIDEDAVRKLAALLEDTGLAEIEYESGGQRVRLARNGAAASMTYAAAPAAIAAAAPAAGAPAADDAKHPGAVLSPMVGTAYLSSQPGAAPFIKLGDSVAAGQTLLIIEAMKTFNPIRAPKAGKVARINISDGQPVEFGEPLMIVE
ncbi:MAG: acetyl-CoA carboxylase biotin carboxyl carrier protein subunit [Alphaproteobacteria bacterium]|jgi:acetyl-CoA carboxylase biotin carboxyl carrier protein|nr:acetyl-CoA carboxylase biotin carboxyl carrier protein subunit [Alphaproteobacteria bacterium]